MDLHLSGRVAVVTGASKGIGLAVTRGLLEEGAKVVAVSRKSSPELDALAGADLVHFAADLMDPAAPALAIAAAVENFGGLDILVNNAGGPPPGITMPRGGFFAGGDQDWQAIFEFNLFSVVRTIRAAIPELLERGGGSIVNVSTGMAHQPAAANVEYGAAKAGLTNLSKVLSEEFGPQGIRVNTVSPGAVRTAWWTEEGGAADVIAGMANADRDSVMDRIAPQMMGMVTGRLVDPVEVADAILLLASPRSGSTTGADFAVDGGFLKGV
ncbi:MULTISPECIES: SDR family oxidoreductase [Kitasatospora]|uniref:Putative oxidoreductase n=1 Tax=Kitasatospora setae (strain ATCC 33774 / DSM 43861 / JCM 3304 / KCC A-0304 / NBRC 14216 / KM-6054) TaxID=452652 RepID=E4N3Z9_KITSK|nr:MULTISPECIES: SDR family oxidoreductase [Kitasatospora]BAJ31630.1 putative oxidoreductase [Kitasatospora setae KM-6054]